jgi:hypothetical protein
MKAKEWAKIAACIVAISLTVAGYHYWSRKMVEYGLGRFVDNLKAAGFREVPPIRVSLAAAVSSHDQAEILRAFNSAVYSPAYPGPEVTPLLKGYLNNPDPFVRLNAANDLTIMGDTGGEETLIALAKESSAIAGIGQDVRMGAAETLAKYRVYAAIPAIQQLYAKTQYAQLLDDLSTLGAQSLDEETYPYVESSNTIIEYGETKETRFLPQIALTFHKSRKKDLKVAAAWALVTLAGDQEALDFLLNAAQQISAEKDVLDGSSEGLDLFDADLLALKCLGTIRTPAAKHVLEMALGSRTQLGISTALINMVLNQGGSDRANQLIVDQLELRGPPKNWQPWDIVIGLADMMPDNPKIQNALSDFARDRGNGSTNLNEVERGRWPAYPWADGYMVEWVGEREPSRKGAGLTPSPRT